MTYTLTDLVTPDAGIYAIPEIYHLLHAKLGDPYASNAQLADIIQRDPGLTLTVLKIANSAFYGFPAAIATVSQAVALLGRKELAVLVLSASTVKIFNALPIDGKVLRAHWAHSLLCGLVAKHWAARLQIGEPERFFVAGLLHDTGRLVLWHRCPELSRQVLMALQTGAVDDVTAEREVFGWTHAEVGAALMRAWHVPPLLIATTQWHHDPSQAGEFESICQIVQIANTLAHDTTLLTLDDALWQRLTAYPYWSPRYGDFATVAQLYETASQQMREMIGMFCDH